MQEKIIIHLCNDKIIEYIDTWVLYETYLNKLNSLNNFIQIGQYIIPTNNIEYIEFEKIEKGE